MRKIQYGTDKLREVFVKKKVLTLDSIKETLGTTVKMTAFRKLKMLAYRSSYSHAGKYYTLDEIATYDEYGLWSFNRIHFSVNGSLINAIRYLIDSSEKGCLASELKELLKVRVQEPLLKLYNSEKLHRRQIGGQYLYLSVNKWQRQFEKRKQLIEASEEEKFLYFVPGFDSPELKICLKLFLSTLDEKQRRLYVGFESMKLGRGGDTLMSKITGINVKTIARGRKELVSHDITPERIRKQGAGRPCFKKTELLEELEALMEDDTAGDPMSTLKWSRKSTYAISKQLRARNIFITPRTTGKLFKHMNYSLKANRKAVAETQHPDRNRQFEIISEMKKRLADLGQPVISVDSKKKELIGNFKNHGTAWSKEYDSVFAHDFRSMAVGIARPYGIYDQMTNNGTVVVGTSYDTPAFAVDSIESWLVSYGWHQYPHMKQLLILCDSGGSNSYRARAWKYGLYSKICRVYGISITVCHYPPGASKWNPVDHQLFSFISINWAGKPLRSYEIMLNYIRNTTTQHGLEVDAILNETKYEKGIKISDAQMNEISLTNNELLPQWNYTISP